MKELKQLSGLIALVVTAAVTATILVGVAVWTFTRQGNFVCERLERGSSLLDFVAIGAELERQGLSDEEIGLEIASSVVNECPQYRGSLEALLELAAA